MIQGRSLSQLTRELISELEPNVSDLYKNGGRPTMVE